MKSDAKSRSGQVLSDMFPLPVAKERQAYRIFLTGLNVLLFVFIAGAMFALYERNSQLLREQEIVEAKAHLEAIVIARHWNAAYGGVYVLKGPGVRSNPYLPGTDLETVDGRTLAIRNPAMMTEEISEYARKDGLFTFHLASLDPINPLNAPDDFERQSLLAFAAGARERSHEMSRGEQHIFRFMTPLYVEKNCLPCHAKQGYDLGDIRGGISIAFDVTSLRHRMERDNRQIIALALGIMLLLHSMAYMMVSRLSKDLSEARRHIQEIATTDSLTGCFNRLYLMQRLREEVVRARREHSPLSCILFDIDHFKQVNDRFGHLVGDKVLKAVADQAALTVRTYDILARYGGEEFIVLAPEVDLQEAASMATRIGEAVRAVSIDEAGQTVSVTISLGVADFRPGSVETDLLKAADDALYEAKTTGRDKIVVWKSKKQPPAESDAG